MKIKNWLVSFIVLFIVDYLWHGLIFASYYQTQAAGILRFENGVFAPMLVFAGIANIIYAIGFAAFLNTDPVTAKAGSLTLKAMLLGFVISGYMNTYNYTIFRGLPLGVVMLDTLFGIVAGAIVGYSLYLTRNWFSGK